MVGEKRQLFVCLAAGKGTRMGGLSTYLQKCMYPLDGVPFVEYTLRELRKVVSLLPEKAEVVFVVGHFAEQLEAYFGSAYHGIPLFFTRQEAKLGTADAVRTAFASRPNANSAIVWLADSFFPAETVSALQQNGNANALTLLRAEIEQSAHHRVEVEGPFVTRAWHGEGPYIDAGLWKLTPEVLQDSPRGADGEHRMLHAFDRFIERGGQVGHVEGVARVHLAGDNGIDDVELRAAIQFAKTRGVSA